MLQVSIVTPSATHANWIVSPFENLFISEGEIGLLKVTPAVVSHIKALSS